jgi:RNA polymerase sigma-70 factor (ECF subfamily)
MPPSLDIDRTYRRHGHLVLRRARQVLGNDAEAHDVLQEVFLSLIDRPKQYQGRSALTTWLYSATTHLCWNKLRSRRTRSRLLRDTFFNPAPAATMQVEEAIGAQDLLARLPRKLAMVAVYYYMDEMSHEEIAEVMGCSRRQIGNLIKKMHQRVQKLEKVA